LPTTTPTTATRDDGARARAADADAFFDVARASVFCFFTVINRM
jgi:hypothetical protein